MMGSVLRTAGFTLLVLLPWMAGADGEPTDADDCAVAVASKVQARYEGRGVTLILLPPSATP